MEHLPSSSLKMLPLILSLHPLIKTPSPSFVWVLFRYCVPVLQVGHQRGVQQVPALLQCTSVGICQCFSWGRVDLLAPQHPAFPQTQAAWAQAWGCRRAGFTCMLVRQQFHTSTRVGFTLSPGLWGPLPPCFATKAAGWASWALFCCLCPLGKHLHQASHCPSAKSSSLGTTILCSLLPQFMLIRCPRLLAQQRNLTLFEPQQVHESDK